MNTKQGDTTLNATEPATRMLEWETTQRAMDALRADIGSRRAGLARRQPSTKPARHVQAGRAS